MHKCNIASDFAEQAVAEMKDRAASRDCDGERSMARCVNAFNAMFGHKLTVVEGWQFMELLKMAHSVGGAYREDDFVDGVAYAALAGEAAADAAAGYSATQRCEVRLELVDEVLRRAVGTQLTSEIAQELANEVVGAHFGADHAYFMNKPAAVPPYLDDDVIGNAMAQAHEANVLMEGDPNGG